MRWEVFPPIYWSYDGLVLILTILLIEPTCEPIYACAYLCEMSLNFFYCLHLLLAYSDILLFLLESFLVVCVFLGKFSISSKLFFSVQFFILLFYSPFYFCNFWCCFKIYWGCCFPFGFSSFSNSLQLWSADPSLSCITFLSLFKISLCYLSELRGSTGWWRFSV